jgi:hypothetical protein
MTSSSIRVRTYVFLFISIENQSIFSFNLFFIVDNQSSIFEFLSSMRISESDNFFDVAILIIVITKTETFTFIDAFRTDSTNTFSDSTFSFSSLLRFCSSSSTYFSIFHILFFCLLWHYKNYLIRRFSFLSRSTLIRLLRHFCWLNKFIYLVFLCDKRTQRVLFHRSLLIKSMILFYYSCSQNSLFCDQWMIALLWSWFLADIMQIIVANSDTEAGLRSHIMWLQ